MLLQFVHHCFSVVSCKACPEYDTVCFISIYLTVVGLWQGVILKGDLLRSPETNVAFQDRFAGTQITPFLVWYCYNHVAFVQPCNTKSTRVGGYHFSSVTVGFSLMLTHLSFGFNFGANWLNLRFQGIENFDFETNVIHIFSWLILFWTYRTFSALLGEAHVLHVSRSRFFTGE